MFVYPFVKNLQSLFPKIEKYFIPRVRTHEKSKDAEATMTFPNEIAKDILAFYFPGSYTLAASRLDRLVFTTISISKQRAKNPSQLFCLVIELGAILLWFFTQAE